MFRKVSSQDISHDYVEERLSAYIDGRLPEVERVQVRKHLQVCPSCQASLDSLGWTVRLLKQIPAPPLPRQFTLPIPEPKPAPVPWLKWGLATASALAGVAFVFLVAADILSHGAASPTIAMPAAAPAPRTLVAVQAPTSAPAGLDRAAAPTSAPLPEQLTLAPAATSAPQPTVAATATEVQIQSEAVSPTEATAPLVAKSAPPPPSCQACGGGVGGGGPDETPQTNTLTAASPIAVTGTVRDGMLSVRDSPFDKAARIGLLARGMQVQVLSRDGTGDWLQIVFPFANDRGLAGWVTAKSIGLPVPEYTLPTVVPPTETPTPPPGMTLNLPQITES